MCEFVVSPDVYGIARSSPRGFAFIVNIRKGRPGSEKDVDLMTSLFSSMSYDVQIIEDQTKEVGFIRDHQMFIFFLSFTMSCKCLHVQTDNFLQLIQVRRGFFQNLVGKLKTKPHYTPMGAGRGVKGGALAPPGI